MKTKTIILFEPGEKEKLRQLLEDNEGKPSVTKQLAIKDTFNVSMGVASIVLNRIGEIFK